MNSTVPRKYASLASYGYNILKSPDSGKNKLLLLALVHVYILLLFTISSVVEKSLALEMIREAHAQTSSSRLPDFNFAAVGDWGCNSNTKSTVNNIINKNPELVLELGDYSYRTTADCWINTVEKIDQKMKISIGNHDDEYLSLLNQHIGYFGLTKQYYSFNYQNVHFVVMSTESTLYYKHITITIRGHFQSSIILLIRQLQQ